MVPSQDETQGPGPGPALAESPGGKAAAAWVQQFVRTLKTCRLYDEENTTAIRFRAELAAGLAQLLDAHSKLTLTFSSTEILCEAGSDPPAAFPDETLAATFFRDGIRNLGLLQGIQKDEVDGLLTMILRVSGPHAEEEDLVTLIWDADLPHVTMNFVAVDGDIEGGDDGDDGDGDPGDLAPWPSMDGASLQLVEVPEAGSAFGGPGAPDDEMGARSDDWIVPVAAGDPETVFGELDRYSRTEIARFQSNYHAEYERSLVRTSLDLMRDCLEAASGPADTLALRQFLTRPLHEALATGEWAQATEALDLIQGQGEDSDLVKLVVQDLCQPASLTSRNVVARLDREDAAGREQFLEFARKLGPTTVQWLMHLLAVSEDRETRLALAATVSELCRDEPEQMAAWLSDSRWYVVRNVVHILGRIGGPRVVSLLQGASEHEEFRVRHEVVTAVAATGGEEARPLLLAMLNTMDTRLFCAALRQLSDRKDPELAGILLGQLQAPGFPERPAEERRAVYVAVAAVGDDETVPALEAELAKGHVFTRHPNAHQRAVARCLLHLDTPRAREALAAGCRSRRPAVRKACEEALGGSEP